MASTSLPIDMRLARIAIVGRENLPKTRLCRHFNGSLWLAAAMTRRGLEPSLPAWLVRHSQRKRRATARPNLRSIGQSPTLQLARLAHPG
jgi:hypothetical protein